MARNKIIPDAVIADGLVIRGEASFDKEPRFATLLMKGFIVYLVVMGSMGCLLSSFNIPYHALVIHLAVFIGALFSSFLYYTKVWENLGYFVLFAIMLGTAIMLRRYISSGFFAVVNIISERAAYYFDTEVVQGYAESIGDRNITVTVAMIYVGWVHAILLNALISRQMKYFAVMFCSFFFLTIPFYLEREPDMLYVLMLLIGCLIVFAFRGARHTPITKTDERYEVTVKRRWLSGQGRHYSGTGGETGRVGKWQHKARMVGENKQADTGSRNPERVISRIDYVYAVRHHLGMIGILAASVLLFGGVFQIFVNKDSYETAARGRSEWKLSTQNAMENIYKNGILGLFNRYESTGGLRSGVLGGVNSVNLDYETDLEVTYVPYSSDRVYIRSFTGDEYLPIDNRWQRAEQILIERNETGEGNVSYQAVSVPVSEETTSATARLLKERYEEGVQPSAKARMEIRNIAAARGTYLPYYIYEPDRQELLMMNYRQNYDMTYYPWLGDLGPVDEDTIADGLSDYYADSGSEGDGNNSHENRIDLTDSVTVNELMDNGSVRVQTDDSYTSVPQENRDVIDAFITEAGLDKYRLDSIVGDSSGEDEDTGEQQGGGSSSEVNALSETALAEELIGVLGAYFQENIPYTYQPGITPRGTDFVNYFLEDNRRGYCAHFASASTLILRRLGYKARYVEGYAIDATDLVEDARVRQDLSISDYYDGDNLLNQDSQVVTVNVTDAMAHAWVELQVDGHWRICELTPWTDEAPPSGGFLQGLIDFLSGGTSGASSSTDVTESVTGGAGLDDMGRMLGYGIMILAGGAGLILLIILMIRLARSRMAYARAGLSDKLVMDFHRVSKKADVRAAKIRQNESAKQNFMSDGIDEYSGEYAESNSAPTINYRDRVNLMMETGQLDMNSDDEDELVRILEKAGFSGEEITEEEYNRARKIFS